jgi:signal transduction histidine kinase
MQPSRPQDAFSALPPPRDRLLAFAIAGLFIVPLLVYAWVAVEADRDTRIGQALDRNQSMARLAAGRLNQQCDRIVSVLGQLARSPSLPPALRPARESLPDLRFLAAYRPDGSLLACVPEDPLAPRRADRTGWFRTLASGGASYAASVEHLPDLRSVLLLAAPVREGGRPAGCLLACLPCDRVEAWLSQSRLGGGVLYVADAEGHVIATSRPLRNRWLPLEDYPPMRRALQGNEGAEVAPDPDSLEPDTLIGYAHAEIPRFGVVAAQPMEAAFAPTDYLVKRLSVLLLPVVFLAAAWAWSRVRDARQAEIVARALAAQNEALRAADRAKSDFLANVSHDLRTPLAGMQVSITGLLDPKIRWTREQMREGLQAVGREADRLAARVRNLLDMSRLEAGAGAPCREPCDLTDVVGAALERLEPQTAGRPIHADFPEEPLLAECDHAQIETVVVNLLENAVKYSPEGAPLHLHGRAEDGRVLFTLRDEGPGLPPGEETKVFEKFYRSPAARAARGTGLGLAICKAIVEAHGGEIGARRAPEGGAEFWFALPALPNSG